MSRGDLIKELQLVGFTEYEARCLLALIEDSPATAYDIAKRAGMPRPNVYGALESLARKGAVQPIAKNPARYVPVDPETFLGRIAEATTARCNTVARHLRELEKPAQTEYVWSIPESEAVHARIDQMIDSAARHVWIKGAANLLAPHRAALLRAAARGVELVIILFGREEDRERYAIGGSATVYLHEGSGSPVGLSNHLFSLTTDFSAALTASIRENGYGIYTQNRPVVVLVESLIRHEIYIAEIFQRFGGELDHAFGPKLIDLRRKYLPKDQVDQLEAEMDYSP